MDLLKNLKERGSNEKRIHQKKDSPKRALNIEAVTSLVFRVSARTGRPQSQVFHRPTLDSIAAVEGIPGL